GDDFPDDENTPGKVTILGESSNWDDDERNGGKILVLQEEFSRNQQDFLIEYLPQWDDQIAIQKQRSESEWENPFVEKRGEDHTFLHLSKNNDDDDNLPYLKFRNFKQLAAKIISKHEEQAFPTSTESGLGYPQGKGNIFSGGYGEYHNSQWTLPPAWTESGVILVLLADLGLWSKVISRCESITINRLNNQTWPDNKAKLAFVENLLGESEILMGLNDEQDRAYKDLDRITCKETKNLWSFLEDFRHLAIKSGKLYFPSKTEKLFAKLPPSLSKKIEESFMAKYHGLNSGVLPAIKFTHNFVSEMCKDATLAKELRDLSLCSAIPIPGYYKNNRKKYGMRKSRTYKGKPHNSHVKPFKRKYRDDRGRVKKSAAYQELDLDDNWDIVLADFDDSSVYKEEIDEGDSEDVNEDYQYSHYAFMFHPGPPTKIADVKKEELWQSERSLLVRDRTDSLKIIDQLKTEQIRLEEQKDEEIRKLKAHLQEKKEEEIEVQFSKEEFPPLGNSQEARPFIEAESHNFGNTAANPKVRKVTNQLYNVKVKFEISSCPAFGTTAIIDIVASACCINKRVVPKEALEPLTQIHVTPAMEDSFRKHVDSLLRISGIRPSKSRHQTMAMIVNSRTTIDPVTGKEIKGKERMVFNYKSLNDNTYKDQYSLPGINTIIKKVRGAEIFSKFDLKSGFHQVSMDEESIPCTAFLVPGELLNDLLCHSA
ncbi:Orf y, partial [Tanacetum coccineum]